MNKKLLSFLCVSLISAFVIFALMPDFYTPDNILPQKIMETNRIVVDDEMVMEKVDGIWSSSENEFYPLDNEAVIGMLENFEKASIYAKKVSSINKGNYKLVLENDTNKKIELYFHKQGTKIEGANLLFDDKKFYFPITMEIPAQPYQWFSQPLFPFEDNIITKISGVEKDRFSFSDLTFLQATRQDDFSDWDNKKIDITLDNGIVLNIILYTNNGSYWLSVKMKTTIMPTIAAKEYINDNKELYDGWFFEIPQPVGNKLF